MKNTITPHLHTSRRSKRTSAVAAAVGLLLALTAPTAVLTSCGGDSTTTTTAAATTSTTEAAPAALADGDHFAFVRTLGDGVMTLDPAEFLSGEAAVAAAREDGLIGETEDLPNDFYIRNTDETAVEVRVDPSARFTLIGLDASDSLGDVQVTFDEFARYWSGEDDGADLYGFVSGNLPMNVTVSGGSVSGGAQQYLP